MTETLNAAVIDDTDDDDTDDSGAIYCSGKSFDVSKIKVLTFQK